MNTQNDKVEKLVEKLVKLEKSLVNTRDENNVLRAITRKNARKDVAVTQILELFEKNVKKINPKKYQYVVKEGEQPKAKNGNVVGMSDWHIGEDVEKNEVITNEVNYKVFEKRIKKYIHKIKTCNIPKTENVVIADLGDNIRGVIHNGLTDSEDGLMVSLVKAVEYQSMFIDSMLELYNEVDYRFIVGNHSRLDDQIVHKKKFQDYSWLIVQMLIKLYSNEPRIKFNVSETGYQLVKLNSIYVFMFHGDTLRGYNPTQASAVLKVQGICNDLYGKSAKHFFSGHTHIATTVQNRWLGLNIVSGTLVGNNEYGLQSGFGTINVSQCMFNVDTEGDIEDIIHFNLK